MVNWMMAVISSYFVKALYVAGVDDPVVQNNFLEAWSSLTKQTFLREHAQLLIPTKLSISASKVPVPLEDFQSPRSRKESRKKFV